MMLTSRYSRFDALYVLVIDSESVNLQYNLSMAIFDEIKMVYYRFNQSNTINTSLLDQVIPLLLLLGLVIGMLLQCPIKLDRYKRSHGHTGIGYVTIQTGMEYSCIGIGCKNIQVFLIVQ
eukprot:352340_1